MVLEILCQNCQELLKSQRDLKDSEKKILRFINHYQKTKKFSPSYSEIQLGLGIKSDSNLSRYLVNLKRKLYIDFTPGLARDIKILRKEGWLNE